MKKEKGITLVALVITIVILIILAGVSIHTLMGEDGIITVAKQAKENIEIAQRKEQEQLNILYEDLVKSLEFVPNEESDYSTEYIELQNKFDTLKEEYDKLQESYNTLQNDYDTLETNYNEVQTDFSSFKSSIANAITEMGEETQSTDTATTMVENIKKLGNTSNGGLTVATTIQTGTVLTTSSTNTVNVANLYSGYADLPSTWFDYIKNISTYIHEPNPYNGQYRRTVSSVTYVPSTGTLTIVTTGSQHYQYSSESSNRYGYLNIPIVVPSE